jgi:hypothetical protein
MGWDCRKKTQKSQKFGGDISGVKDKGAGLLNRFGATRERPVVAGHVGAGGSWRDLQGRRVSLDSTSTPAGPNVASYNKKEPARPTPEPRRPIFPNPSPVLSQHREYTENFLVRCF